MRLVLAELTGSGSTSPGPPDAVQFCSGQAQYSPNPGCANQKAGDSGLNVLRARRIRDGKDDCMKTEQKFSDCLNKSIVGREPLKEKLIEQPLGLHMVRQCFTASTRIPLQKEAQHLF